jgi:hypothetical protein
MSKISHQKNNDLRGRFKCPNCPKKYMMEWAFKNHIKHCVEKDKL